MKKKPKRGGARPGAGRPATGESLPRKTIRVSDAQWDEWGRKAEAAGMSRSEWIRQACDAACDRARQ